MTKLKEFKLLLQIFDPLNDNKEKNINDHIEKFWSLYHADKNNERVRTRLCHKEKSLPVLS